MSSIPLKSFVSVNVHGVNLVVLAVDLAVSWSPVVTKLIFSGS